MSFFVMNIQCKMMNSSSLLFEECNLLFCNMSKLTAFCLPHILNTEGAALCFASHVNYSVHRVIVTLSHSEKGNCHLPHRLQPILSAV